jgi:hypothetical protein
MPRELGDERARYGRKSWRERLEDVLDWPSSHSTLAGVLVAFVVVGLLVSASRGLRVDPDAIEVGDCLFVRATVAQPERPIGDQADVVKAVVAGSMEKAACDASHGHEVSRVVDLTTLGDPQADSEAACSRAFEAYVGHAEAASRFVTFAAVPTPPEQAAGATLGICLVARGDGQWMDHPARGSGE